MGTNAKEQIENDLTMETKAVQHYNEAAALCADIKDGGTREILEEILSDEEEHVKWLETQLRLIQTVGIENYLTEQMGEKEDK